MNYKNTVFLPRTDFPMRGSLPIKEPQILQNWQDIDIYEKLRVARKDAPTFVLHDGPPYANGHLHIGHALNKILKDVIFDKQLFSTYHNRIQTQKDPTMEDLVFLTNQ